jgi:hypothetical protein
MGCDENKSPLTRVEMFGMPGIPLAPVPVTPCFLPAEAVSALQASGMVGTVAQVLD